MTKRRTMYFNDYKWMTPNNRRLIRYTYKHLRKPPHVTGVVHRYTPMSRKQTRIECFWILSIWKDMNEAREMEKA